MKFLLIRIGDIGDIVLTTPLARCLKKQLPLAELHYLVAPSCHFILEENPNIDKIHHYRDESSIGGLQKEKYDLVVDLQDDEDSKFIVEQLDINAKVYDKLGFKQSIYTRLKLNIMPHQHMVSRYLDTVADLGIKDDGLGLDFFIPANDAVVVKDIPASHHLGYLAMVIGGSKFNKRMPVAKLQEICRTIDHPIILLGGKEDFNEGYEVSSIDPIKIYNACGKFNFNESADLIRRSKLVISHDTGLMHVAAALNKPIISVWGSTVPSFGMTPYYGKLQQHKIPSVTVQVKGLWCRPCSVRGLNHCPQGHFKCMKKISVREIIQNVNAFLKYDQNSNSLTEG